MYNVEAGILKDISYEKVYEHLDFLVNDIGERQSGIGILWTEIKNR